MIALRIAQCSLVEVDRRFRGVYCLHCQGVALMTHAVRNCELTDVRTSSLTNMIIILGIVHRHKFISIILAGDRN
jgi:hypothetical protein